jgi:hypothetical protein
MKNEEMISQVFQYFQVFYKLFTLQPAASRRKSPSYISRRDEIRFQRSWIRCHVSSLPPSKKTIFLGI